MSDLLHLGCVFGSYELELGAATGRAQEELANVAWRRKTSTTQIAQGLALICTQQKFVAPGICQEFCLDRLELSVQSRLASHQWFCLRTWFAKEVCKRAQHLPKKTRLLWPNPSHARGHPSCPITHCVDGPLCGRTRKREKELLRVQGLHRRQCLLHLGWVDLGRQRCQRVLEQLPIHQQFAVVEDAQLNLEAALQAQERVG